MLPTREEAMKLLQDGYTYRRLLGCDEVAKIFNPFFQ